MRILSVAVTVALVQLISASGAWAQTADEVIERSLKAVGGRAAHEKLKSRLMTGTITLTTPAGDIAGTVEILNAVPNKARSLIKADLSSLGAGPLFSTSVSTATPDTYSIPCKATARSPAINSTT